MIEQMLKPLIPLVKPKLAALEKDVASWMQKQDQTEQQKDFALLITRQSSGLVAVPVLINDNNEVEQITIQINNEQYRAAELRPLIEKLLTQIK